MGLLLIEDNRRLILGNDSEILKISLQQILCFNPLKGNLETIAGKQMLKMFLPMTNHVSLHQKKSKNCAFAFIKKLFLADFETNRGSR